MTDTESLLIKNFGPITEAAIDVNKVTVLIGRQGSGKSTVAKLYSVFSWLEKSLMRHSLTEAHITQYHRFRKTYCAFNNISDYFRDDTVLRFNGTHFQFQYENDRLQVNSTDSNDDTFNISKVMYIPAERSILGSTDRPYTLKGLSDPMSTFRDEYSDARNKYKSGYILPFDDIRFEYDALNDIPRLKHNGDFDIKLSAGSSGFHSSLPMLLVSKNLTEMVKNSSAKSDLTEQGLQALNKEVRRIMEDTTLSYEVRMASLHSISSRFRYSRFINIVEEMELNLFPDSQRGALYELIADANVLPANKLMLTTHSPYLINYLTLAIKAHELTGKASDDSRAMKRISEIVPPSSQIPSTDVTIYEMEDGSARRLSDYHGLPSDDNFLNLRLEATNTDFNSLLDIEEDTEL